MRNQNQTPDGRAKSVIGAGQPQRSVTRVSHPNDACLPPSFAHEPTPPGLGCSGYFAQHHVDTLIPTMNPVQFLAHRFPGKTEQEYRQHLGNFQITGMTGLQPIGTLSGDQKSRVAFSLLSLQRPHILLLDEVRTNRDFGIGAVDRVLRVADLLGSRLITWIWSLDGLMLALSAWNGGVIVISHDERFITSAAKEVRSCWLLSRLRH